MAENVENLYHQNETPVDPPSEASCGSIDEFAALIDRANVGYKFTGSDRRLLIGCAATGTELWHTVRALLLWRGMTKKSVNEIAAAPAAELQLTSCRDLFYETLPEMVSLIPDLLYEGLIGIIGPPKVGKGWLLYDMIVNVAGGKTVLGRPCVAAETIYLTLEDNKRRAQSRISKITRGEPPSEGCYVLFSSDLRVEGGVLTLGNGLEEAIANLLDRHPMVRFVAIDTLGRVTGRQDSGQASYNFDVQTLTKLQTMALARHICIGVVHHTRKANAADSFDTILGTQGLRGTFDLTILVTRLGDDDDAEADLDEADNSDADEDCKPARLRTEGRDVVKALDIRIEQDPETCAWQDLGKFSLTTRQAQDRIRQRVLRKIIEHGNARREAVVEWFPECKPNTIDGCLRRLVSAGELRNTEHGTYAPNLTTRGKV
ncbi:AAA family ATPase [Rhodopila sp.]|uniref:AAA family ATPase n=1 Tax=Rhodopila sp. TaxID=2480087 RepID=UPI003D119D37